MFTKLIQSTLIATLLLGTASVSRAQSVFPDVPDNHWAAAAVKRLAEAGIIEGLPAVPQINQRRVMTPVVTPKVVKIVPKKAHQSTLKARLAAKK